MYLIYLKLLLSEITIGVKNGDGWCCSIVVTERMRPTLSNWYTLGSAHISDYAFEPLLHYHVNSFCHNHNVFYVPTEFALLVYC